MKEALGFRATGRKIICADDTFELREVLTPYSKLIVSIPETHLYGINNPILNRTVFP
jgi:hypothetical protein